MNTESFPLLTLQRESIKSTLSSLHYNHIALKMFRPGLALRLTQSAARPAGRRFASTTTVEAENEFIAKRAAMRDHAVREYTFYRSDENNHMLVILTGLRNYRFMEEDQLLRLYPRNRCLCSMDLQGGNGTQGACCVSTISLHHSPDMKIACGSIASSGDRSVQRDKQQGRNIS